MDRIQGQPGPEAPAGSTPAPPARIVRLTAGDFTLAVNPVDGSEIEPLRPDAAPRRPTKRDAAARRSQDAAVRPPVLPGAPAATRPLLGREEDGDRLVRLLARGRSVRLTGPAGSGRTALLDQVAARCADLAPDGVVRLSGHGHQQPGELLQALYTTVFEAADQRPDRIELLSRVRDIGAVVLLDDLEMGGPALDELLRATPECAYLLAATPGTRAPSDDSHLEEVFLTGLSRAHCLELLERGTGRPLTDQETAWATDLAFASEGLPLRFVQAAALLRQRDELNRTDEDDDEEEPGVFEGRPRDKAEVPLPTLAEGAAPAELLASRVSESARAALRTACALGGELPHPTHLPALVGDTHADAAVAELLSCGLLTPVGTRYRLAAGVARQLEDIGYGDTAAEEARTAARHYAWWTGHTSVTPEQVAAEADAVLAALSGADVVAAVLLARTAAPAFAASLRWEAWERVLRSGAEAARKAGEVAEQAYFHHELGVLALCEGRLDRARAELETSIGLRGALADKRGTVAGRRALALVVDREAAGMASSPPLRLEAPAALPPGLPAAGPSSPPAAPARTTFPGVLPGPAPEPAEATFPGGTPTPTPAADPTPFPAVFPGPGSMSAAGPSPAASGFPAEFPGKASTSGAEPAPAPAPEPFPSLAPSSGPVTPPAPASTPEPFPSLAPSSGPVTPPAPASTPEPFPSLAPSSGPVTPPAPASTPEPFPSLAPSSGPAAAPAPAPALTPDAMEAVTRVNPVVPVIRRPDTPSTLAAVFEDAFPLHPKPAAVAAEPAPGPFPEPPRDSPRRRRALLIGAGALTVVALGTVVSLALGSSDTPPPAQRPTVSSTPARQTPPAVVAEPSGNDPAPQPPADPAGPADPASSGAPEATRPAAPGRTPSRTPSPRPSPTPTRSQTPPPSPVSPAPTSPDPTGTGAPTATSPPSSSPAVPGTTTSPGGAATADG